MRAFGYRVTVLVQYFLETCFGLGGLGKVLLEHGSMRVDLEQLYSLVYVLHGFF